MFELSLHNDAVVDAINAVGDNSSNGEIIVENDAVVDAINAVGDNSSNGEIIVENQIIKKQKVEIYDENHLKSSSSSNNDFVDNNNDNNDNNYQSSYKYFENIQEIIEIQQRMEKFDLLREQVIKECRDIQKWSKQSIFSIHRGNVKEATSKLQLAQTLAVKIADLIKDVRSIYLSSSSSSSSSSKPYKFHVYLSSTPLCTVL